MSNQFEGAGIAVRHVDEVELPRPLNLETFILTLRRVFFSNRDIREVVIRKGEAIKVTWVGPEHDELEPQDRVDVREVLSSIDLEEISKPEWPVPMILGRAALRMEAKRCQVSHVLVGIRSQIWQWAGKYVGANPYEPATFPDRLMGGLIVPSEHIPPDTIILVGSRSSVSHLSDAIVGVKITMEISNARNRSSSGHRRPATETGHHDGGEHLEPGRGEEDHGTGSGAGGSPEGAPGSE